MSFSGISVVIPSLNPDENLIKTVESLKSAGFSDIILVDDGSDTEHQKFFPDLKEHPYCTILRHKKNRGKGAALKSAFRYILREKQGVVGVVTADSDGQHTPEDIASVAEYMKQTKSVVLGARDFSDKKIPLRSRFGNKTTHIVFRLLCGMNVTDTQTGLRAIPIEYLKEMLHIKGERYEYETNVLLSLKRKNIPYTEKRIHTVYIENNKSSHFRPIIDSIRIYKFIAFYCLSSLSSCIIDLAAFYLFCSIFGIDASASKGVLAGKALLCTVLARVISSVVNFLINKNKVFDSKGDFGKKIAKYYTVALPQMIISAFGVYLLGSLFGVTGKGILTVLKAVVDTLLFFLSFRIQQTWVFAVDKEKKKKEKTEEDKKKLTVGKVIRRALLSLVSVILAVVITAFSACFLICYGPSETFRNRLVLMAAQASATGWVPKMFLSDEKLREIYDGSHIMIDDVIDSDDIGGTDDDWSKAIDGMLYYEIDGPTYKGYMLIIKDPSRVSVGASSDNYATATAGGRFYEVAQKYNALVCLNAGEFNDYGGSGSGAQPVGITYAQGKRVWTDGRTKRTYIGFDKDNKMVLRNSMTVDEAESLGIRDMVAFQENNILIETVDGDVVVHHKPYDTGTSQRTAIGQRADGAVIMLVTDGRTASCLGATPDDVITMLLDHGAVNAAMLDGGSSTMMYYRDFYKKYDVDTSTLDQYQQMGLVNRYKAFVTPRRIPTYFIVTGE